MMAHERITIAQLRTVLLPQHCDPPVAAYRCLSLPRLAGNNQQTAKEHR